MGSRLDGPSDRKKDLDKRYDPKGGGRNPFRPTAAQLKLAKAKAKAKKRKTKKA